MIPQSSVQFRSVSIDFQKTSINLFRHHNTIDGNSFFVVKVVTGHSPRAGNAFYLSFRSSPSIAGIFYEQEYSHWQGVEAGRAEEAGNRGLGGVCLF